MEQLAGYESFECCLHVLLRHFPVLLLAAKNAIMQYCSVTSTKQKKLQSKLHIHSRTAHAKNDVWQTEFLNTRRGKKSITVLIIQTSATKPDILPCSSGYNIIRTDLNEEDFHMMH